jgi:surface polysaccharide O-acyltransferase-like enzyme
MIQRQQSLWLLLSAISAFLTYKFPFYTGTIRINNMVTADDLDGGSKFFLLIFTGASLILSLVTIFLFKDRKLQLKLSLAGAVLSILILIIYFIEMKKFETGSISLSAVFVFAMIAGYIMAARGIRKDEKLVKSLDKLR